MKHSYFKLEIKIKVLDFLEIKESIKAILLGMDKTTYFLRISVLKLFYPVAKNLLSIKKYKLFSLWRTVTKN